MSIGRRVHEIIDWTGISQVQFAKENKIGRTSLMEWKKGINNPSGNTILKLLEKYPEINANWLIHGEGNMLTDDDTPTIESLLTSLVRKHEDENRILTKYISKLETELERMEKKKGSD